VAEKEDEKEKANKEKEKEKETVSAQPILIGNASLAVAAAVLLGELLYASKELLPAKVHRCSRLFSLRVCDFVIGLSV